MATITRSRAVARNRAIVKQSPGRSQKVSVLCPLLLILVVCVRMRTVKRVDFRDGDRHAHDAVSRWRPPNQGKGTSIG